MSEQKIVNKKITPEIQARLDKILGLTTTHEFLYVPKLYREVGVDVIPKSEWPIFKLRGKNGIEVAEAEDEAGYVDSKTTNIMITSGKQRIVTLSKHILGWKNYIDRDGKEVKCTIEKGHVYKTCMQRLPADLQRELHEAINEQSKLTSEELEGLEY